MTETDSFPDELLQLQERLHRAHAEHRTCLAELPWSVEPLAGWVRGERFSHRGDVPDSPGWRDEQKDAADRMWAEIRELSIAVTDHTYWATVPRESVVSARMRLKRQARPALEPDIRPRRCNPAHRTPFPPFAPAVSFCRAAGVELRPAKSVNKARPSAGFR
ncbi:hypothetical protein ACFWAR_19735 [Streptomyces sp. NPDC059917]|uniref:hypothetical protein n=1 Tax=Streptomyces sp. NPDC059917 TaxID=3347002 RepID=UPI00364639E7